MAQDYPKKFTRYRADVVGYVDYKDVKLLQRYISSYGKIEGRKRTGHGMRHQRSVAVAIKRARHLALLPFTVK